MAFGSPVQDDPGRLHGGGCLELTEHLPCAGDGDEDEHPWSRGQPQPRAAGSGVDLSAETGNSGGCRCAGEARPGSHAPPTGALPARLRGSRRPPGDLGASAERKRARRQPRDGGDAAWQRGGGSAASVPPAFVLAAAPGARPGAMKGPSVCAPAALLGFHS